MPIYLSVLLLLKTLSAVMALISPVTSQIPAATGLREVLGKIPGYSLLRGLVARVGGPGERRCLSAPALVELEDALVPAMIIEELADGRFTVLVPSVPTPAAGALCVLPATRVHRINVPLSQLLHVYSKWGEGTGVLVKAMR